MLEKKHLTELFRFTRKEVPVLTVPILIDIKFCKPKMISLNVINFITWTSLFCNFINDTPVGEKC